MGFGLDDLYVFLPTQDILCLYELNSEILQKCEAKHTQNVMKYTGFVDNFSDKKDCKHGKSPQ